MPDTQPTPTISVSVTDGLATLTGSGFQGQRAVCINITGPVAFRKYIHPDRSGNLSYQLTEATASGEYSLRATQVGPGSAPITTTFTK